MVILGMAASAFALLSNQVVKTTISPPTTMAITPTKIRPKMPAAMAPREACEETERSGRLPRDRPWLAAEASSNACKAGRAKANRFAILLIASRQKDRSGQALRSRGRRDRG